MQRAVSEGNEGDGRSSHLSTNARHANGNLESDRINGVSAGMSVSEAMICPAISSEKNVSFPALAPEPSRPRGHTPPAKRLQRQRRQSFQRGCSQSVTVINRDSDDERDDGAIDEEEELHASGDGDIESTGAAANAHVNPFTAYYLLL